MSDKKIVKPYENEGSSKKEEVATMFNQIAHSYDFLNHFFSVGIDKLWRRKVIRILSKYHPKQILDVATGTGDLALALLKLKPQKVIGVDISEGMLNLGKEKVAKANESDRVELQVGDSENLNFKDNSFDAVTVAFGVRNYENLSQGLKEMHRVLKPDAPLVVLEFSKPENRFFRKIYFFYFQNVLPSIGKLVSKDARAYSYLPESVNAFPEREEFVNLLKKAGFKTVRCTPLTFGISSIYEAVK